MFHPIGFRSRVPSPYWFCVPILCVFLAGCAPLSAREDADGAVQRLRLMGISPTAERLIQFSGQGDVSVVQLLLDAGIDVNAVEPRRQTSAIHSAAANGHLRLAKVLIARGANVNLLDWHGNTPLIDAVYFGHRDLAVVLLDHGAKLHYVSLEGVDALSAAVYRNDEPLIGLLIERGNGARSSADREHAALQLAERIGNGRILTLLKRPRQ